MIIQKSFSYKEAQFRKFCLPVTTNCPSAENINETLNLDKNLNQA